MKKHKAFTLIELLVVISIMTLLVSILMPALGKAKEQAKNAVCQSNLKSLGQCFMLYLVDYNDFSHKDMFCNFGNFSISASTSLSRSLSFASVSSIFGLPLQSRTTGQQ